MTSTDPVFAESTCRVWFWWVPENLPPEDRHGGIPHQALGPFGSYEAAWADWRSSALNDKLREESGRVDIDSRLVSFLYQLMRDELPPGRIEKILRDSLISNVTYSNGWLARYAEFVAKQLTESR